MKRMAPPPTPRLEIRDLRVVLALAQAGTTAGAGALLHLTQPAVSRALLAAEDRLEARLFDRTPRGLVLTDAGQRLVAGASELLVSLGELERRVATPSEPPVQLRLACGCFTAYQWLPSALVALRQSLPSLRISLAVEHTEDPIQAIESGEIDVALSPNARVASASLEHRKAFSDEVLFVVAASHPLASRTSLTRADLCEYPLLVGQTPARERGWFVSAVFGRQQARARFDRIPLTEAMLEVARAGQGIAVLSEWTAAPHLSAGDLVPKRLDSGPIRRTWSLIWRREHRAAATRLLAALGSSAPSSWTGGEEGVTPMRRKQPATSNRRIRNSRHASETASRGNG